MIRNTVLRSLRLFRGHFTDLMYGAAIELALVLLTLAPLLFTLSASTRFLAVLTPLLAVFLLLPCRMSAAEAWSDFLHGGRFATPVLLPTTGYTAKLLRALRQAAKLIGWGCLFIAASAVLFAAYKGMVDGFTMIRAFMDLGGGSLFTGLKVGVALYVCTLLPLLFGMLFHAWVRHGAAQQVDAKAMKGHRGRLLVTGLLSAVTLLPFAIVIVIVCGGYFGQLMAALQNIAGGITLPPLSGNLWIVGVAFLVLCVPLMPLKSLMIAVFTDEVKQAASASERVSA